MNILITDDEPLIHISIEKIIQSCDSGLCIYHAYTGHEMLNMLVEHEFILAFVDIKMPGLSGLETIQQALNISPMTRYYIMSGFDEFEYAKQAIKLKVEDYLLKPLDKKTIQETISAAKDAVQAVKRRRKSIFRNWLESGLNHRKSSLEQFAGYYCSILLVTMDHPDFPKEAILEKLMPYTDNFVSILSENQLFLLCFSDDANILRNIRQQLSGQTYSQGISLFSSSVTSKTEELAAMLEQIQRYSSLRILLGIENFYFLKPLTEYSDELLPICSSFLRWQAACRNQDYTEFINQTDEICRLMDNPRITKQYRENILYFLSYSINEDIPISVDSASLKDLLYKYGKTFLHASDNGEIIQSIIEYIQTHYRDVSIAHLSEHFGLSANYISTLIKQKLGIRYNDYITSLRLNQAKKLLLTTNQSVKDITSSCGYYSQSHFTKLFIEHENCTPTEYRKLHSPK